MKAKELLKYHIELIDLDGEYLNNGAYINVKLDQNTAMLRQATPEETELFLEKEVINFEIRQNDVIPAIYRTDGDYSMYANRVVANVSKYSDKERAELKHMQELEKAQRELERLVGKKVLFGDELERSVSALNENCKTISINRQNCLTESDRDYCLSCGALPPNL